MEPSPPKRSYFQPLAVNGILIAVLSLVVIRRYTFDGFGQLVMGALAFPMVNFACFMLAFAYRQHHLVRVYSILTLVWLGLMMWGFIASF